MVLDYVYGLSHVCFTDVRLINGRHAAEGVVKVLLGKRWYGVCDDMWDDTDAKIVCKQLGYSGKYSSYERIFDNDAQYSIPTVHSTLTNTFK